MWSINYPPQWIIDTISAHLPLNKSEPIGSLLKETVPKAQRTQGIEYFNSLYQLCNNFNKSDNFSKFKTRSDELTEKASKAMIGLGSDESCLVRTSTENMTQVHVKKQPGREKGYSSLPPQSFI